MGFKYKVVEARMHRRMSTTPLCTHACKKRVKDTEIRSTDGFQEMFSQQAGYGQVSKAEMLMFHVLSRYMHIDRGFKVPRDVSAPPRVIDFFMPQCRMFIEIDGPHHFCGDHVELDIQKMHMAFHIHPRSMFIRIRDVDVLGPLTRSNCPHADVHKPFPIDWVNIILALYHKEPAANVCVFIERAGDGSYDAHKGACEVPWRTICDTSALGVTRDIAAGWKDGLFTDTNQKDVREYLVREPSSHKKF